VWGHNALQKKLQALLLQPVPVSASAGTNGHGVLVMKRTNSYEKVVLRGKDNEH
jgi:hypothetical protein